jgi:hypothetical protein
VRHVVIQTAALQNDMASLKLTLRRLGSSDNQSDHFTKLLPLVPFWTHTNALMGARFLTKQHLDLLGFDPFSCNCHLISLFRAPVSSSHAAHELRGMKDHVARLSCLGLEKPTKDRTVFILHQMADQYRGLR